MYTSYVLSVNDKKTKKHKKTKTMKLEFQLHDMLLNLTNNILLYLLYKLQYIIYIVSLCKRFFKILYTFTF